jgi:hypothetical protein
MPAMGYSAIINPLTLNDIPKLHSLSQQGSNIAHKRGLLLACAPTSYPCPIVLDSRRSRGIRKQFHIIDFANPPQDVVQL